jgi:hypothetical protein
VIGSVASLAGQRGGDRAEATGRVIAAWPSFALIGSYELLMRQECRPLAVLGRANRPRDTAARVTNCHSTSSKSLVRQQRRAAPGAHRLWLCRHLAETALSSNCGRSLQTTLLLLSL